MNANIKQKLNDIANINYKEKIKDAALNTLSFSSNINISPKMIFVIYILLFIVSLSFTIYSIYMETHAVLDNKKRKFTRAMVTTFIFLLLTATYGLYTYYSSCDDENTMRNKYISYLFAFISVIVLLYGIDILTILSDNKFSMLIFSVIASTLWLYYANYTEIVDTKWAIFIAVSFISVIFLFSYNPYDVVKKLSAVNILTVAITCIFFILMAVWYSVNPYESPQSYFGLMDSTWLSIIGLIVSLCVIVALFASFGAFHNKNPTTGTYVLNILIIVGLLSILYNMLDLSELLNKHPLVKLVLDIVLYIPCLLVNLLEFAMGEYYATKYSTLVLIILEIIFIIIYYFYPKIISKIYTRDGELLINKPVSLNKERTIGHYDNLSGNNNVASKQIKNPIQIKVGDLVEVKQPLPNTRDAAYISNIKNNKYDVVYKDGTMSYNALKKWIKPVDKNTKIVIGTEVTALKVWLVGYIQSIKLDRTYTVKYKTIDNVADYQSDYLRTVKSLFTTDISDSIIGDNINKGDIRLLDENKSNMNAYKFSISFWVYINSMPPNTNKNYTQYTSLLNYSNYPNVMFKPSTNELIVAVINNKEYPKGIPADININNVNDNDFDIIYSNKNILLQKWNQFIINYDGGTMDIFYNGELVNSSSAIVPNMVHHDLTIGAKDGISAGICNVVYYNHPLDIITINNLYDLTKIGGTPNVPESTLFTYKI